MVSVARFDLEVSVYFLLDSSEQSVWIDTKDEREVDAYLTDYLQDINIYSNGIGDIIKGNNSETKVHSVGYSKEVWFNDS